MSAHVVLGIDPGYDRVGWCIARGGGKIFEIIESGQIQTSKTQSVMDRYRQIQREIAQVIEKHHPEACAIESIYFSVSAKTAIRVAEAKGVILGVLAQHNEIDICEYSPPEIKLAVTGNGSATKKEIEKMLHILTNPIKLPKLDDELDAIAIAYTHVMRLR